MRCKSSILTAALAAVMFFSCGGHQGGGSDVVSVDYTKVQIPEFSPDSAFAFVEAQLAFGYRAPGHAGHDKCAAYLAGQMRRWADTVVVQPFTARLWNGESAKGQNIVASFNLGCEKRVLLGAHWDSRLWADHDPDTTLRHSPIMGANDGASGVAVLMEMARVMSQQLPAVGIDIVFFDLEDQGIPEWAERYDDDTWCLGSQYWSKNPHRPGYQARYGILLDMVGVDQPRFTKEQFSRYYAPTITDKVWAVASALGQGGVFQNVDTDPILDDHYYVNGLRGVPMLDIVQNSPSGHFYPNWHTVHDDLDAVTPVTLGIVGRVVLTTIYSEE